MINSSATTNEFRVPMTLDACAQRITAIHKPYKGILSPGVDAVVEAPGDRQYCFRLYRRYDPYKRRPQSTIYVDGDLRPEHAASTLVSARVRVRWGNLVLSIAFSLVGVMILSFFAPPPIRPIMILVPTVFWLVFVPRMVSDARALIPLLHERMGVPAPL